MKRRRSAALLASAAAVLAAVIFFYGRQGDVPQAETVSRPETKDIPVGQPFVSDLHSIFTSSTSADSACDQDSVSRGQSQVEWAEKTARIRRDAVPVLTASTTAEHKLAAALLAYWDMSAAGALELLVEAGRLDPSNPMIAARMLQMCQIGQEECGLSIADLEMQAVVKDRGNADAWARVATSRASRSDYAGALDALQEAASAPEFNEYYVDYILLFDRALAASTELSSDERLRVAYSYATATPLTLNDMSGPCMEQASESGEWLNACLRWGERQELESKSTSGRLYGLVLQQYMYRLSGDAREEASAKDRQNEVADKSQKQIEAVSAVDWSRHEPVLRNYLDMYAATDEFAAMDYLQAEMAWFPEEEATVPSSCSDL